MVFALALKVCTWIKITCANNATLLANLALVLMIISATAVKTMQPWITLLNNVFAMLTTLEIIPIMELVNLVM